MLIEEELCYEVRGAAISVHRALGPGLLESAYDRCLAIELHERNIPFENQVLLPISYRGHLIEDAYRADFIIDKRVVIEVKAVSKVLPVHLSQIHTYVRLTGCRLGLLMNFHSPKLVDGITRVVY